MTLLVRINALAKEAGAVRPLTLRLMFAILASALFSFPVFAEDPPEMKMTTEIPPGITTPDDIETRLGDLHFFDGVPDKETVEKAYNFLDFQHAYQACMSGMQIASMDAIRKGLLESGPANTTAVLYEDLLDSKSLYLTGNTTSVYMFAWLQLDPEQATFCVVLHRKHPKPL